MRMLWATVALRVSGARFRRGGNDQDGPAPCALGLATGGIVLQRVGFVAVFALELYHGDTYLRQALARQRRADRPNHPHSALATSADHWAARPCWIIRLSRVNVKELCRRSKVARLGPVDHGHANARRGRKGTNVRHGLLKNRERCYNNVVSRRVARAGRPGRTPVGHALARSA